MSDRQKNEGIYITNPHEFPILLHNIFLKNKKFYISKNGIQFSTTPQMFLIHSQFDFKFISSFIFISFNFCNKQLLLTTLIDIYYKFLFIKILKVAYLI